MEITGDNWDSLIYKALDDSPPRQTDSLEDQHCHVVRTILITVGESVRMFLIEHLSEIAFVANCNNIDAISLYINEMGWYFLYMLKVMNSGKPDIIPGWQEMLKKTEAEINNGEIKIAISFQIGFPLLVPHLVQKLLNKPVGIIVHSQNTFAIKFFQETISDLRIHFLEELSSFDLMRSIKENYILVANMDTAYQGTRSSALNFLHGCITIPNGLFTIAARTNSNMQCFAISMNNSQIVSNISTPFCPTLGNYDPILKLVREFFEPIVRESPFQWMGWGNFRKTK